MPKPKPDESTLELVEPPADVKLAEIQFRGTTFTIPVDMDEWETEACIAIGQQDYVLAAKLLLGQGQWALLQSLGSKRKDIREFLLVFSDVISKDCIA